MEFIWVVGLSAVGKRTFIQNVLGGSAATALRGKLGLSTVPEAVAAKGSGFWSVLDVDFSLQRLLSDPDVQAGRDVLIKFQNQYDRVDAAGRRLPFSVICDLAGLTASSVSKHRIIALWAEPTAHVLRYMKKHGDAPAMANDAVVKAMKSSPPDEERARGCLTTSWKSLLTDVQRIAEEGSRMGRPLTVQTLDASDERYLLRSQ